MKKVNILNFNPKLRGVFALTPFFRLPPYFSYISLFGGNWIVWFLEHILRFKYEQAYAFYHYYFRKNKHLFFMLAIILVFVTLFWRLFRWITRYFKEINQGIDALLSENDNPIQLSTEMLPFERKLNTV